MYKTILLPYDFGNSFENVPDQLAKMTENSEGAKITIFNVITENEMSSDVKFNGKRFNAIAEEKREQLKPFTDELDKRNLAYEIRFEVGRVITELLNEINNHDYEVVVMSNRRSKRDIKHVLGHVTHKIAKRVNVPVMIIK
ncbi:Universal stress protein family protein [Jeotgalicoccus aerolatus]|uniref:Nucleotide-binding universal stress UspA family protein n=1 Tax=Jeotgalicoccus aerolatus TaxID=709510 RepID=A0ABS4HQ98_9STAP|nr:universal stress protein [Jeotgalicoccus aerolatus]MBP1953116.1 nucleotide-binding universal stress UspA family protein [Jeotgalicoccus aerolatus]GGE02594.1 universal stress protein [Jeotgalicoccus aerolatus]CAD2073010.1 Universal stress protein family protein [Jeotgalicoccus aerolatus]